MTRFIGIGGLICILGAAYALSNNRRAINFRLVAWGLGLQIGFAFFILKTGPGQAIFDFLSKAVTALLGFSSAGAAFVFGPLATDTETFGLIIAFQVLPIIIFTAALFSVLYYLGIMQIVVTVFAKVMSKTMGASGAESLAAAANVFMGMTEAPLVIKPFVSKMTQSEMMALMTGGMATIAGSVMAGYIQMGVSAGHLLTASVMAAPAGLVIAKILYPETETPLTQETIGMKTDQGSVNLIDAIVRGASDGLRLALNVAAMLIAFVALVALANGILGLVGITLEQILGYLFAPVAFVIGVPWSDVMTVGSLLGQKIILNEFVAYSNLTLMLAQSPNALEPRSIVIVTYALAGFANLGSIGIMIGGLSGIAPERRSDIARLSMRSLMGGMMATLMTASIAGLLL
jgi:CNT family concentrative nucleoside transporter